MVQLMKVTEHGKIGMKVQGLISIMKVSVSEPFAYWIFCQYTKIAFSVKPRTTA